MPNARRMLGRLWRRRPKAVDMHEAYVRWAPVYPARPHNRLMEIESAVVEPLVRSLAARRALDVGTGTGRNLATLSAAGVPFIVGLDLSESMLREAKTMVPRVRGDAQTLPFADGAFDLVTSSLMCGDVPDLGAWLGEAARVLRPGGQLVYSDFHSSWTTAGWTRTFEGDDGHSYELPFHAHTTEEHVALLRTHGMVVRQTLEPMAPERPTPVVLVIHAIKPDVALEA